MSKTLGSVAAATIFVALATPNPATAAGGHESGISAQATDFSSQYRYGYGRYYARPWLGPRIYGGYYRYGPYSSYGSYGAYGSYGYSGSYPYYRDDPPGSAYQDRSIREDNGLSW